MLNRDQKLRSSYLLSLAQAPDTCAQRLRNLHLIDMANVALKLFYGALTIFLGGFIVLPLAVFGVFTFTLAVWFLCTLALFKWVGAIWHSLLHWWKGDPRNSPEAVAQRERAAAHAKRMARSQSGSTSASQSSASNTTTRSHSNRSNRSNSNVSLATLPQLDRDYEGTYYNTIFHFYKDTDSLRRRWLAYTRSTL